MQAKLSTISLNKRMFVRGCTTPDPWQAKHASVIPGIPLALETKE